MLTLVLSSEQQLAPLPATLYVRDSATGENTDVGGVEGPSGSFLQIQAVSKAPLYWSAPQVGLVGRGETYWCQRLSTLLVAGTFSDASATCSLRLIYIDENDIEKLSEELVLTASGVQDGVMYMAGFLTAELLGAKQIAPYVESVSVGTVDISLAGV